MLTLASILLGYSVASRQQDAINIVNLLLVILGALSAHISVNTFNEYFDFRSGLDTSTVKTPFSGGSGALIDNPDAANAVLYLAITALCITIGIGLYFSYTFGLQIFIIGIVGVILIVSYTTWLNCNPWICLLAPGIGFGPLMVTGTHIALTGNHSGLAAYVSLVPLFLASNLLLLNQYPDIDADQGAGRKHFPIVYGLTWSTFVYGLFVVATCLVIMIGIHQRVLPAHSTITFIPMLAAIVAWRGAMNVAKSMNSLMLALGMNALAAVSTPVVLALTIIYA